MVNRLLEIQLMIEALDMRIRYMQEFIEKFPDIKGIAKSEMYHELFALENLKEGFELTLLAIKEDEKK